MKTTKLIFSLVLGIFFLSSTTAQDTRIEMNFQGLLKNSEGEKIADESFDFSLKLLSPDAGKAELWKQKNTMKSDENGWFSFILPEVSQFLSKDGEFGQTLVIQMEFIPNAETKWLKAGEDFMLSYNLVPTMKDGSIYLKMTRMEGSELTYDLDDNLYVFKDEYPFAYLTGGFLLTDAPPVSEMAIADLRLWIEPEKEGTRGVKGAFPQGSYRKR